MWRRSSAHRHRDVGDDVRRAGPTGSSEVLRQADPDLTHNADGTLATVKDANNSVTTFGNWRRGIPQAITYADSTVQSAVVDDRGRIASVTDETGAKTCHSYDVMGRLASITYPSEAVDTSKRVPNEVSNAWKIAEKAATPKTVYATVTGGEAAGGGLVGGKAQ